MDSLVHSEAFAFNWEPGPLRGAILGVFLLVNLFGLVAAIREGQLSEREREALAALAGELGIATPEPSRVRSPG